MIKETAKYRALADAIQSTFGVSSEVKYSTHFMKANILSDDKVLFTCAMTVRFGHKNVEQEMRRKYIDEAVQLILQAAKRVEEKYKENLELKSKLLEPKKEPYEKEAPKTIKLTLDKNSLHDSLEQITYSIYSPEKACIFRLGAVVTIE